MRNSTAKRLGIALLGLAISLVSGPRPVQAIPTLQLYIEGSTYDSSSETWVFVGDDFKLWVLGDVGSFGTISAVKLTAAYAAGLTGSITITPAVANPALLPSPDDPSLSAVPILVPQPQSVLSLSGSCGVNGTIGTIPCMGNNRVLPSHDEFGTGTQWTEFLLGDFTLTDSPIGDYTTSAPPATFPSLGQINAYDISVSGFPSSTEIHFDAFDHTVQRNGKAKYVFAPFSHDALDSPSVPEPSTLLLLGTGLLVGLAAWRLVTRGRFSR